MGFNSVFKGLITACNKIYTFLKQTPSA